MENENHGGAKMFGHSHHKKIHIIITVTLALLSLLIVAKIITEVREWRYIGSGITPTNTISVQGEGEVFAVPDVGIFTFSVIEEGKTVQDVQSEAAVVVNKAMEYLKKNGVDEKDIKTTSYNVYPRYEQKKIVCITYPCPRGDRVLVGFEINQSVRVKVRDTDKVGMLLSGIGEFGVERISGLTFIIDDEDELKRQARQVAVAQAKAKAEALANDLNVRLVRIVNFNEYGSPSYARFESTALSIGGDSSITPNISTGENSITSTVNITYEIR